ncbi:MAG: hypothetical protein HY062_08755 [Bacteroidetes bacterium]|nr:hypothetical protein [Bacteroidota bacterium]
MQKLNGEKTSNEISQANLLTDEAALNFKQAQKLRTEAEAYPSGAAKLGGLSNAEEKENEALAKQQKALEILSKANPTYKVKTVTDETNPANAIANVNNEITKTTQSQLDAYASLSKANQNELKLQSDKLLKNQAFKSPDNKQAQDLKAKADQLTNETKAILTQTLTAKTPAEKANLLLKANEKEIAAINALTEANNALSNGGTIASNNARENNAGNNTSNPANNTTTPVSNETNVASNTNTANNNVSAGGVDNNNSNTAANNTNNPASNGNNVASNTNTANNNASAGGAENNNSNANNTNTAGSNTIAANTSGNTTNNTSSPIENTTPANSTNSNAIENNASSTNPSNNSASIIGNGVGDEASKLKTGLNNTNESNLTNFNTYTNSEAIALKEKAQEKINTALNEDKQIGSALENVNQLAANSTSGGTLSQDNISTVLADADRLNNEAFALRKGAATKTGAEKDADISKAKELETAAISKKIEAADKQKQLNTATYNANKQSLEELAAMAKGKNIAELANADAQNNEANLFFKQASNLRTEADAYPNDAARLGGYSNAEEKETQAMAKQQALLDLYKKHFPNYQPKKASVQTDSPEAIAKLNETKTSLNNNNQQHIEGLSLLAQANEKEYKNRILMLPTTLNTAQTALKTKAQTSYKKQQELVAQANQATDANQKKNLLITANQYGQDAINTLNQITNPGAANNSPLATNNTTNAGNTNATNTTNNVSSSGAGNPTNNNANNAGNNSAANTTNNAGGAENNRPNPANTVRIKVEGLEVKNTNAYSAEKPIPIDEKIPDGLVFKVQIGAFKAPLPNNTFKGLSPVIAQTTPSGYIRYMAGNFDQYGSANAVKNDLRNLGYSDAFVVAYYNGVRINLGEATEKAKAAGQTVEMVTNTSAGITANSNVPKNTFAPPANNATANTTDVQPVEITNELEKMNGLLYTVQIGVYSKQVTRGQLFNLRPIYTEKLPSGLYRYTAGIYNQSGKLLEDKRKVVDLGVKDAFVSAYYNAKRISFAEGQKLQTENSNLKMETENPIIFSGSAPALNTTSQPANTTTPTVANTNATPSVNAFTNGVTSGPVPTPENGVKADETGISFKVQIGAYKNQVPNDVASKFLNIKTWPVKNVGITDAYITVYKDGKKLYGAEATQYLSK